VARSNKKTTPPKPRNSVRKKVASSARIVATKAAAVQAEAAVPVYEVRGVSAATAIGGTATSGLWGRAVTQWQLGDWQGLAEMDLSTLDQDTARAQLAALAACAHLQLGDKTEARRCLAAANRWKCPPQFLVRALAAGVETSMALYHALCGREDKEMRFLRASAGALGGDAALAARARKALSAQLAGPTPASPTTHEQLLPPEPTSLPEIGNDVPLTLEQAIEKAKNEPSPFKPGINSYAQNFEDVMLWRALGHVEKGFYIDIGAQHPVIDSVSKAFYEKGWRGIHVEATPAYAKLLREDRPDEIVIEAAVSDQHGSIKFYEIPETGISTGDAHIAAMHREKGFPVREINVPTLTLADILSIAGEREIHWLKIDVEGMEKHVIKGWGHHPNRPWILVVEATLPLTTTDSHHEWEHYVIGLDYFYAYNDGLSRFYINRRQSELLRKFTLPPNVFDNYRLKLQY
jgi:FkbM family methyltransferase